MKYSKLSVLLESGVLIMKLVGFSMFGCPRCCASYETENEALDHLHLLTVSLNYGLTTFCHKRAICLGNITGDHCSHCSIKRNVHVHSSIDKFICTGCYCVFPMMILCEVHMGLCKLRLLTKLNVRCF